MPTAQTLKGGGAWPHLPMNHNYCTAIILVEAVGVEPTSSARSTRATTCLFHRWVSPAELPVDRPFRAPVSS